ncbi:alpha/beta hydrolase [Sphingomonas sp.]|uniref:alpha/beta fold hydrolase n=1 Tax=Sphingomonas sp. TaxID=28214 RepID=UPI00180B3591|nr:alpha/beta hydrolase [Sphingomonas sp.]MBA4760512.1 alpha/beta fold hydrolase [Sphingomonas sp.]
MTGFYLKALAAIATLALPSLLHAQDATVVLESGLGDGAKVWDRLRGEMPGISVFAYDRPGYGKTPAANAPRDPCTIARELHERLALAQIPPPYVLVGHSLGGQYAYAFARLYRHEIKGLVLVDATPPGHWEALQKEMPTHAGALKVLKALTFSRTMRGEFNAQEQCLDGLPTGPMGVPVRILLRTRDGEAPGGEKLRRIDHDLARRWLALTGANQLELVDGAGHYIQRDRPDFLAKVIRQTIAPPPLQVQRQE